MASLVRTALSRSFAKQLRTCVCPHINAASSARHNVRMFSVMPALSARKYSEKHEWIDVEGGIGTIGITNYAQDSLGDIVYAQLPEVGEEFEIDGEFGALESVKAASELYTPVTCVIKSVNEDLADSPGKINKSPYDEGWLIKVELKDESELDQLMDDEGYEKFLKSVQE